MATRKKDEIPKTTESGAGAGAAGAGAGGAGAGAGGAGAGGAEAGAGAEEPELVMSLSDSFIALLDRLLAKLGKIFGDRHPEIDDVLQKLRKKVYVASEEVPPAQVEKTRSYRKAIVEAWNTQTKVYYETFAKADPESPEMTEIIAKMSSDNYFLHKIGLQVLWAREDFGPSKKVLCKNLRLMNVLSCLLDLFSGDIEKVLVEISSKFTEIFEGGGTMTSDDLQKFVHHLGQHLSMDNMIKVQKVVKKVIVMLGGVEAFEGILEKVLGKNQLLTKIISALIQSEKPASKEGAQSSQSILSSLNSKYGSVAGVTVEEDEGEDDDDDEAETGEGGAEEDDDVGCSRTSIHVTRADMQRTFEAMKAKLSLGDDAVSKVMTMAEQVCNGDDGAYSSIVATAAVAASSHGLVLDEKEFERLAKEGVEEAKATVTPRSSC